MPVRSALQRAILGALLGLSVLLLALGRAEVGVLGDIRMGLTDLFAPVVEVLGRPVRAVRHLIDETGALFALKAQNEELREQNRRLLHWQAVAQRLEQENAALRSVLRVVPEAEVTPALTARVIADGGGSFVRAVLINAGEPDGVVAGMAAVNGEGLVGRVVTVGRKSAQVLLLTDLNSRIPIRIEPSGDHAILQGDNGPRPHLRFLPLNPKVAVGDRVATSGLDGLFPPGLPVGVVTAVDEGGASVTPFVDWGRLDYLRLLDYPDPEFPAEREAPAGGSAVR